MDREAESVQRGRCGSRGEARSHGRNGKGENGVRDGALRRGKETSRERGKASTIAEVWRIRRRHYGSWGVKSDHGGKSGTHVEKEAAVQAVKAGAALTRNPRTLKDVQSQQARKQGHVQRND